MGKTINDLNPAPSGALTGDIFEFERETAPGIWTTFKQSFGQMSGGFFTGVTTYVDSNYGDDSTGELNNPFKPFATIAAAELLASSGANLHIRSGAYSDSSLGKNGIRYEYESGCTHQTFGYCYTDSGSNKTFTVVGNCDFTSSSAVCFVNGVTNVLFECRSATGDYVGARGFWVGGNAQMIVYCKTKIYTGDGSGSEACLRLDTGASTNPKLTVYCPVIESESIALQIKNANPGGVLTVYCDRVLNNAESDNYTVIEQQGGTANVYGNWESYSNSNYGIGMIYKGAGVLNVNGKLDFASDKAIQNSGGDLTIIGNIVTRGTIVNSGNMWIKGDAVIDNGGSAILHTGGKTITSSFIKNLSNNQAVIEIAAAGYIAKQGTTLYVTGTADSVTASTAQNFKGYVSSMGNQPLGVNVTDLMSGFNYNALIDAE